MSTFFSDSFVIKRMSVVFRKLYFTTGAETSKLFRIFQSQKFAMLTSQVKQRVTERKKH